MSRPPRPLSKIGLYHIIFRGINRQNLFEEEKDYERLLDIIREVKRVWKFELYAYCFMTNHVHLFMKENELGEIKKIMHTILTRYVVWYHRKYQRSGSLVGNRYKSEPIEDEKYALTLIRYIHQNPIKANMVERAEDYLWSSYREYSYLTPDIVNIHFALSMISDNLDEAIKEFKEFQEQKEETDFSITNSKKLTDEQLKRRIIKITQGVSPREIAVKSKMERNEILARLRREGLTIGQLERLTGISRGIITGANNVQK